MQKDHWHVRRWWRWWCKGTLLWQLRCQLYIIWEDAIYSKLKSDQDYIHCEFKSCLIVCNYSGPSTPANSHRLVHLPRPQHNPPPGSYVDGFPVILESIKVDKNLHVQLQYNGHAVPLPTWFTVGRNAMLTRFSQLSEFPNAIRIVAESSECSRSLLSEMLDIANYKPKGRPPYSSNMIRFALHLRYISFQSYKVKA